MRIFKICWSAVWMPPVLWFRIFTGNFKFLPPRHHLVEDHPRVVDTHNLFIWSSDEALILLEERMDSDFDILSLHFSYYLWNVIRWSFSVAEKYDMTLSRCNVICIEGSQHLNIARMFAENKPKRRRQRLEPCRTPKAICRIPKMSFSTLT